MQPIAGCVTEMDVVHQRNAWPVIMRGLRVGGSAKGGHGPPCQSLSEASRGRGRLGVGTGGLGMFVGHVVGPAAKN